MSSNPSKGEHPLDAALAERNMFSWFAPAFALLARHWPVALLAGGATALAQWLLGSLPWPFMLLAPWWLRGLHAFLGYALVTVIAVSAYRAIAHREGALYGVGDVNSLPRAVLCAVQVSLVWLAGAWAIVLVLGLIAGLAFKLFAGSQSIGSEALIVLLIISVYGLPLLVFLLSPVWMTLGVAGALANAHAARSREGGLAAVLHALQLAFGQRWRVFWPSYLIGAAIAVLVYLEMKLHLLTLFVGVGWFGRCLSIAAGAVGVALTFVIERVYAPDLGIEPVADDGSQPLPAPPAPTVPPPAPTPAAPSPSTPPRVAPAPAAPVGPAIAELIERDLRENRATGLTDLVARGLTADARFFADHPDSTVVLAKRMVQAGRPDLALRILQPYVKDRQSHRLHLTGALLAAELLARDVNQLPAAARFLAQVKALYPNEPIVDRLIRTTDKAIAEAAGASPQPPAGE